MITKAIITSMNRTGTRCAVRMPLFENAGNRQPVVANAIVNIMPGIYNGLKVGDVVLVAFEENALEKPVIIGKLFTGAVESGERGGGAFGTLKVTKDATLPAATKFSFVKNGVADHGYEDLDTYKKLVDRVKELEATVAELSALIGPFRNQFN